MIMYSYFRVFYSYQGLCVDQCFVLSLQKQNNQRYDDIRISDYLAKNALVHLAPSYKSKITHLSHWSVCKHPLKPRGTQQVAIVIVLSSQSSMSPLRPCILKHKLNHLRAAKGRRAKVIKQITFQSSDPVAQDPRFIRFLFIICYFNIKLGYINLQHNVGVL